MVPGVLGYARFVRGRSRSGMVELILDVFSISLIYITLYLYITEE